MRHSITSIELFNQVLNINNNISYQKIDDLSSNNTILVTGGNGFLGIHLLYELYQNKQFSSIYTIVRNKNNLLNQAKYYQLDPEFLNNIIIIEEELLLMKETLFPKVNFVIHSAAKVHALASLHQLWDSNVILTKKIIDIYKNTKIFFISSLSVFVSSNLTGNHASIPLPINKEYYLYGGYSQSKYIGEKIVESNQKSIIRLGLITGSTKNAIFPNDFFTKFIKLMTQLGCYPSNKESSFVDITPVDICAKKIIDIILNKEQKLIYHIANKKSLNIDKIIKELNLSMKDELTWLHKIKELNLSSLDSILLKNAFFKSKIKIPYFNINLFQSTDHYYDIINNFDITNDELLHLYLQKITNYEI